MAEKVTKNKIPNSKMFVYYLFPDRACEKVITAMGLSGFHWVTILKFPPSLTTG